MSIATQIERINTAKANIKEVVNQDFDKIQDETLTYYPEKIAEVIEEYKKYIPEKKVSGTEINISDAAPFEGKIAVKGNTEQASRVLPEGYTQVDYIESHGQEYIDTGVNADSNLRVVIDMQYTDISTDNSTNFGAITDTPNIRYHFMCQIAAFRFYTNNEGISLINKDTNRHLFDLNVPNNKVIIDSKEFEKISTPFNTNLNFWLFGRNSNSSNLIFYNNSKLYKCKMYVSGVLIRDYVPCYRNSDNVLGLFDLVNDVFYTNDGTGAFTYGSVVNIPNPDYPQDIKVVTGNNVIKHVGKNKLDRTKLVDGYVTNNGEIYVDKTSGNKEEMHSEFIRVKPNTQYIFSIFKTLSNYENWIGVGQYEEKSYSSFVTRNTSNQSYIVFTTSSTTEYVVISARNLKQATEIQFEEGSTATEYEEYREEDLPLSLGNNKYDKTKAIDNSAYRTTTGVLYGNGSCWAYNAYLKKYSDKITFSSPDSSTATYRVMLYDKDKNFISSIAGSSLPQTFDISSASYYTFYFDKNTFSIENRLMVNEGSTAGGYTEYNPIELCKIGDYQDILFKNLADDENYNSELEEGVWYKKKVIEKIQITKDTTIVPEINTALAKTNRFLFRDLQPTVNQMRGSEISNFFKYSSNWSQDVVGFYLGDVNRNFVMRLPKSLPATWDELKTYLSDTPIVVYYILPNPTYSQITDTTLISQLEALRKAKWFKGVNHWWTETENLEPALEGTYKQSVTESEVS